MKLDPVQYQTEYNEIWAIGFNMTRFLQWTPISTIGTKFFLARLGAHCTEYGIGEDMDSDYVGFETFMFSARQLAFLFIRLWPILSLPVYSMC